MPQTSDARRRRWPGMDSQAQDYLVKQGYIATTNPPWFWRKPSPEHKPTRRERDALIYLIEEWDYGGIVE